MDIVNNSGNNTWASISRSFKEGKQSIVSLVVVVLILLYLTMGAYPIVPLENDGMRIALGVQSHSIYGNYTYAYEYESQAGTYKLVEFLANTFNLDYFRAFSGLTIFSGLLVLIVSGAFLRRINGSYYLISFISLLLFQETYVSGYYPNSSMIAAAFLAIAILLATENVSVIKVTLSGVFFAAAVWTRFDTILMGFAFVPLLVWQNSRHFKTLVIFCSVAIATGLILFFASDISIPNILRVYFKHAGNNVSIKDTLNNYSTIFTLAIIYGYGLGLYKIIQNREWRLFLLGLVAPIPLVVAYGLSVTSPKYLLYGAMFWAIPICYGLTSIIKETTIKAERVLAVGILLFAGQYIFSPAYEMTMGRSAIVYTADEARLRGAIAYTPIYYAKYRRATLAKDLIFQEKIEEYLKQDEIPYIISQDWMTNQWVLYFLQNTGYRIKEAENYAPLLEDGQRLILTKGSDTVYLVRWRPAQALDLPDQLQTEINQMNSVLYIGPDYTTTDYAEKSFLSEEFDGQRLPEWGRFEAIMFTK